MVLEFLFRPLIPFQDEDGKLVDNFVVSPIPLPYKASRFGFLFFIPLISCYNLAVLLTLPILMR